MPETSSRSGRSSAARMTGAETTMPALRALGMLSFVLVAACAGAREAPPTVLAQTGSLMVDPSLLGRNQDRAAADAPRQAEAIQETAPVAPRQAEATQETARVAPRQPVPGRSEVPAIEAAAGATVPASATRSASTAAPAPAKAPATASALPQAIEQPRKKAAPPAAAGKPEPPLDLEALKERLRDTSAIGMFTKLALKNQVDDLLQQFRAHHLNGQKPSVAALRQPYDMLVLKVLALIQDRDPSLARTISGSREAIWGILADPQKFNSAG